MDDKKKLVIVMTRGMDDERSSVAWSIANGGIASGLDVTVFLTSAAVDWVRKGAADNAHLNPLDPPMKEMIYLKLGDTMIEVISAEKPAMKSEEAWQVGYRAIALEVEDMEKAVEYLQERGIAIAREPVDLGTSIRGEIRDPDGLTIELRKWK